LDNGLELVAVEQPHLHSAEVSLSVRVGSRHESEVEWGLSHLVEHMLFRGSARFPDTRRLARAFERSGGTLYAATWRDHTNLSLSIHPSKIEPALEALGDMLQHPRFDGLEVERAIVEDELQGELDEHGADTDICNVSRASIWHGHPMGRRIAGSYESVASFEIEDVVAHHARHYVGANTILTVAGRIDADRVAQVAERALGGLPAGERTLDGEAATFSPSTEIDARGAAGAHLQVQLTWEALPAGHRDFLTQTVVTRLLDDGVGSRLQEAVCDRRGLVYGLTTGLDCYADCGLYDIELQVSPRRAATAVATTLETVHELLTDGVGEEELSILRERMLHEIEFSIDSTDDLAEHYGVGALLGDVQSLDEQAKQLREVTSEDVVRTARRMFLAQRVHATLLGPVDKANMKRITALLEGFPAQKPSAMKAGSARSRAVV
jgi:predicted Zn-dependent peptidase